MNQNPDEYVRGMSTVDLEELVKISSYLYYNFQGGGITDNTFDTFEYYLRKRTREKTRRFEKIGAPPVDKIKTVLPYPMASLNKVKPQTRELLRFLQSAVSDGIHYSHKLDGVSGMVLYTPKGLKGIYTRGNGEEGGDITYISSHISLPKIKQHLVVRGEFILSKQIWEEKYLGNYSNARAFVSGKLNSGFITQGISDIKFVAYSIVDLGSETVPKPSVAFKMLNELGFEVARNGGLIDPTIFQIMELYKSERESSVYAIDGLVLSINLPLDVVSTLENPTQSVAFKMALESQIRDTRVMDVEWMPTRYGKLFPVVIFENVYVDGVRIHRATGHTAARMRDQHMSKGTEIRVIRSGDVIPQIFDVTVNEDADPILPNLEPKWFWRGCDIILEDIDNNKTVQIKRMEHFLVTIEVPKLREKTLEKFWEAGITTVKSLTNATIEDMVKIKGIGLKGATSHFENIHNTLRTTRLDRFIPASTTLNLGIGGKLVRQLMRYYPGVFMDDSETIKKTLLSRKIPGFGKKRIENISQGIPKFRDFLFDLNEEDVKHAIEYDHQRLERIKAEGYNPLIENKKFVITGFMGKTDYALEDYIYDNLGDIDSAVSSSTEAVIAGNLSETTSKMITAQRLGVPVYSVEEFDIKYRAQ